MELVGLGVELVLCGGELIPLKHSPVAHRMELIPLEHELVAFRVLPTALAEKWTALGPSCPGRP